MIPGSANPLLLRSAAATGYQIQRSLRFNSSDSAYLSKTYSRDRTSEIFTLSFWLKRNKLGSTQTLFAVPRTGGNVRFLLQITASDQLYIPYPGYLGLTYTPQLRDCSAWYHIFLRWSDKSVWINGIQATASGGAGGSSAWHLWKDSYGNIMPHGIGYHPSNTYETNAPAYGDFQLAEIHSCDGGDGMATDFGFFDSNGTWQPKLYTGSYGNNGFYLALADNSSNTATTLGKDTSGNSPANNWTPNNLSVTAGAGNDSLVDVPTNGSQTDTGVGGEVRGNYCTWNPLAKLPKPADLSNGNLDYSASGTSLQVIGTIGVASGKWYWEVENPGGYWAVGVAKAFGWSDPGNFQYTDFWGVEWSGNKVSPPNVRTAYGYSGAIVGVAFDADAGTLRFYGDGVDKGIAFTGLTNGPYFPAAATYNGTDTANFGQRPFAYTAPSGFKALCTANLPAPVVTKPSTVMDVALYTGNNTARSITGLGFSPDFVWIKGRSGATDHALYDIVRGVQKDLVSNSTAAETTQSTGLTAFNSDGFSIGTLAKLNTNSATYAGWCWDAGSSTVTNTSGSITSQVRANASAGFSIVTYTGNGVGGATVGHGLGVAPRFFVCKRRDAGSSNWYSYHSSLGGAQALSLNTTSAAASSLNFWNNTNPTSTLITLTGLPSSEINGSGGSYVIYAWAPVVGYSSAFSYTGNGSTDGVFVYLGMRPKLLLIKRTDTTGNWYLWDTVRNTYNVVGEELYPNLSNAAATATDLDILSNGFKMRSTAADFNASGGTYVGFAWAESPFNYARAR